MLPINIWIHSTSLKLHIKNLRSWDPAPSFIIEGGKVEAVTYFFILASKTTMDGACSHEFRRYLLLGRKAMRKIAKCAEKQKHHSAQQTGRCLAFSSGFLKFLSSPHCFLKSLSFLVLHNSQDYFVHFFIQS